MSLSIKSIGPSIVAFVESLRHLDKEAALAFLSIAPPHLNQSMARPKFYINPVAY
jgi:hypothetical protein